MRCKRRDPKCWRPRNLCKTSTDLIQVQVLSLGLRLAWPSTFASRRLRQRLRRALVFCLDRDLLHQALRQEVVLQLHELHQDLRQELDQVLRQLLPQTPAASIDDHRCQCAPT